LLLTLLACSGGGDATDPDTPPPVDPPPADDISGTYVLAFINNGTPPGQTVTLTNRDGTVIGLYRFDSRSELQLNADRTWTLSISYEDDGRSQSLEDEGTFDPADPKNIVFHSDRFGDQFLGGAVRGVAAIGYDFNGDGQKDTIFGFGRLGSGS
jgi:hypothetical protein